VGYKILGYAVWNGAKWYLNRRYGRTKKVAAAGVVGAAIVAIAVASSRRSASA
jgi:hypothetical protein